MFKFVQRGYWHMIRNICISLCSFLDHLSHSRCQIWHLKSDFRCEPGDRTHNHIFFQLFCKSTTNNQKPESELHLTQYTSRSHHLNLGRTFFIIMIKSQHPTPGLLRHGGMFYIGHNAINYFFDGSLFVMIINAGVPPPSLMRTPLQSQDTDVWTKAEAFFYCANCLHLQAYLSRCTFHGTHFHFLSSSLWVLRNK